MIHSSTCKYQTIVAAKCRNHNQCCNNACTGSTENFFCCRCGYPVLRGRGNSIHRKYISIHQVCSNINNGTIKVPRNKLNPIFLFGFLISPAIKVTLFHASLLNTEPTMDAAIAPRAATPTTAEIFTCPSPGENCFIFQASAQFADQFSPEASR